MSISIQAGGNRKNSATGKLSKMCIRNQRQEFSVMKNQGI